MDVHLVQVTSLDVARSPDAGTTFMSNRACASCQAVVSLKRGETEDEALGGHYHSMHRDLLREPWKIPDDDLEAALRPLLDDYGDCPRCTSGEPHSSQVCEDYGCGDSASVPR
jgi:hypothetical protein